MVVGREEESDERGLGTERRMRSEGREGVGSETWPICGPNWPLQRTPDRSLIHWGKVVDQTAPRGRGTLSHVPPDRASSGRGGEIGILIKESPKS